MPDATPVILGLENETPKDQITRQKSLFPLNSGCDQDCSLSAQRPNVDYDTMANESEEVLKHLQKSKEEVQRVEKNTINQSKVVNGWKFCGIS